NIAGLPTWYTIRASKDGYIARKKEIDFLVAMNPETAQDDVMTLAAGAAVLYDEPLQLNKLRKDLTFYSVPYDKLVAAVCPEAKLRKLVKNMIYVGVVAQLLNLDMKEVEKALRKQFKKKQKAADLNMGAAQAGYDYAAASLTKVDPLRVERMNKTAGKVIVDGNSAAALGAMFAGVTVFTWYRITPSSSLGDVLFCATLSHGDTKHILLFPSSIEECFTMASDAFELSEHFQTPVFVLSDLDLGMNNWMADPFKYPERPINRGKVLSKEDLD